MTERKKSLSYSFTVEGDTEKWYFEWLNRTINNTPEAKYSVKIKATVQPNPKTYAKRINPKSEPVVIHVCDYESNDPEHVRRFKDVIDQIKEAQSYRSTLKYKLGYSNFSFDLWIALHKTDCNSPINDRSQYLSSINKGYCKQFTRMKQYKTESNFKECLSELTIDDVRKAIERSKRIMSNNQKNKVPFEKYKGFTYFTGNPSLSIWESVHEILSSCDLI